MVGTLGSLSKAWCVSRILASSDASRAFLAPALRPLLLFPATDREGCDAPDAWAGAAGLAPFESPSDGHGGFDDEYRRWCRPCCESDFDEAAAADRHVGVRCTAVHVVLEREAFARATRPICEENISDDALLRLYVRGRGWMVGVRVWR